MDNTKTDKTDSPDLSRRKLLFLRKQEGVPHDDIKGEPEVIEEEVQAQKEEPSLLNILADHIRASSKGGQLVVHASFLEPPFSVPEAQIEEVCTQLNSSAAYPDMVELKGSQARYYYSNLKMSANYANMLFLMAEKDICTTIAETVRFENKTYPRPYQVQMLQSSPYHFSDSQVRASLDMMKQKQECRDIQMVKASNGALYLYSNQLMEQGHARGLCEWIEVEQYENP